MTQQIINAQEANNLISAGKAILVDVRETGEFKAEHIEGAINKPLSSLDIDEIKNLAGDKQIIVQCLSGKRASQACAKIDSSDASILEEGIEGWKKEGLKTVKKGHGITIQRQVMIVAGSLVLIGSLLSIFVNYNFIALPLFVGAGLAFAGLSGWCGMAILLNKMPWNK